MNNANLNKSWKIKKIAIPELRIAPAIVMPNVCIRMIKHHFTIQFENDVLMFQVFNESKGDPKFHIQLLKDRMKLN
jgi:hypothetical protein